MHASDIQTELPIVDRTTPALEAAKLIASARVGGLIVADLEGHPVGVVWAVDILGHLLPNYLRDDMSLAAVIDEKGAEEMWSATAKLTLGELFDDDGVRIPKLLEVDADATIVEVAAQMADARTQVALVRGPAGSPPRFVTLPSVMDAIATFVAASGADA